MLFLRTLINAYKLVRTNNVIAKNNPTSGWVSNLPTYTPASKVNELQNQKVQEPLSSQNSYNLNIPSSNESF
jgi:hypothetical protein